ILVPDPDRYSLIQRALRSVLAGKPVLEALETLNIAWGYRTPKTRKQGNKPMTRSHFYRLLHEEFYCGWIYTSDGEKIKGNHPSMISEADFWEIQTLLGKRGKPRPKWLSLPYRGLLKCGECGCSVCMEEKHQCICSQCKQKFASKNRANCPKCGLSINKMHDPTHLHYIYGRCTKKKRNVKCSQRTIRLEELEKTLADYLSGLSLSPRVIEWVLKQLTIRHKDQFKNKDQIRKNLKNNLETVQRQLDSLLASFTAPDNANYELIDPEEYKSRKQKLQAEKVVIQEKLDDALTQSDSWMETAEGIFDFARTARQKFDNGDYKTRTEIIQHLGSNLTLKDRKITIDQPHPWLFMYQAKQKLVALQPKGLEPEKSIDVYEKKGISNEVISTLQAH
ncbi:MAG TPA: recombinase family protein, partial [Patescibacteria group bacterium]